MAISGEEADFLAGGRNSYPIVQQGSTVSTNNVVTIQYKPFGVAVKFTLHVLKSEKLASA